MDDLKKIRSIVPPHPQKSGKGRPSYTKELYKLADRLVQIWERETGQPFTQDWEKTPSGQYEPITLAAAFVFDAVSYIDDRQIISLRKVMERIVKKRRIVTSPK